MSGPTANLPLGLLDALGIKSGTYPNNLSETILPAVDIIDLIATQYAQEENIATQARSTAGFFNGLQVPATESWLVSGFSVFAAPIAAESATWHAVVAYQNPLTSATCCVKTFDLAGSTVVGARPSISGSKGSFWAAPGMILGYIIETIVTAGTINFFPSARILRVRR